ncbi:MAG: radical SAM family RiPP maturation amino acid epimerase [Candidatus Binatia bacterium]|nr:radical SAM family RiPP maturation amino acid epimerase [Candidatus Binatia bacterium]
MPKDDFSVGEIKRFLEIWSASEEWRARLTEDHEGLVALYGRLPHLDEVQAILSGAGDGVAIRDDIQAYTDFVGEKIAYRERVKVQCEPDHPGFRAWRRRQIARNVAENGQNADNFIIHTPVAIEYSQGCSVGCWYCGVDADKLRKVFEYSPENAQLHRDIVQICLEKIGPAVQWACSYWATDPLDNPEYENFMVDFHEVTGMFPQTTTAQPDKHLERVRELLKLSRSKGQFVDRFSIQSLKQFDEVLRFFPADELKNVELVMQQPQALNSFKANAGRFYRLAEKNEKLIDREKAKFKGFMLDHANGQALGDSELESAAKEFELPGTNSCMSGFWINLAERFIRLASPTHGSEIWPGGWILFEEVNFEDAADFEQKLEGLMQRNMPECLPAGTPTAFGRGYDFEPIERGFALSTTHQRADVRPTEEDRSFALIGKLLHRGKNTPEEIAVLSGYQDGEPEARTMAVLRHFFDRGFLKEEPDENFFERQVAARRG